MPKNHENVDLSIVTIGEMLGKKQMGKLVIPDYQRPYRWSTESAITLVLDTYDAYMHNVPEYRMGSVILHKVKSEDGTAIYNIVDGQQRLTTLSILFYAFGEENFSTLLDAEYNELSCNAIVDNLEIIRRKINEIDPHNRSKFVAYLHEQCTLVKIVTYNEQEAFQFFDSQNSRGKELVPHDLLKSYHLREMGDESESRKIKIISEWENTGQSDLKDLFANHLYPLVRWYKLMGGLNYSTKDIKVFKGIKKSSKYNFSIYHKAANLYIERFNTDGTYELISGSTANQFQLTQPLIAGIRFFRYSLHYMKLHDEIEKLIVRKYDIEKWGRLSSGDRYVYDMFVNVLMFYIDKFSWEALTDARLYLLYKWAFSLRLCMKAVYRESVNNYAQGKSNRVNAGLNIFSLIAEMKDPLELDTIILDTVTEKMFEESKINVKKYEPLYNELYGKEAN